MLIDFVDIAVREKDIKSIYIDDDEDYVVIELYNDGEESKYSLNKKFKTISQVLNHIKKYSHDKQFTNKLETLIGEEK